MNNKSRRHFLKSSAIVGVGFFGLKSCISATKVSNAGAPMAQGYGALMPDAKGILNLPKGFSYKIISTVGDKMDDGLFLPGKPDGMAAFPASAGKTLLVRNHEVSFGDTANGAFGLKNELLDQVKSKIYEYGSGKYPGLGGTSTALYNNVTGEIEQTYLSLAGTVRNCAGGATPWGSWLTCEEDVTTIQGPLEKDHGYVFEIPATEKIGLVDPTPIIAMGRFNHEAVAIDPKSDVVYLTEDRSDGVFYRYLPNAGQNLHQGGKLQVLKVRGETGFDTRNWNTFGDKIAINQSFDCDWIDIDNVEAPDDDLRFRAYYDLGAARFARGEGIWYGNDGVYFTCTNGGDAKIGQVWKYTPSEMEGQTGEKDNPGKLTLFVEPNDSSIMKSCDNLTVADWGDVVIAEDDPHPFLLGVKPDGSIYKIAENVGYQSEFAGVCFSPDGSTLFVNIQGPGLTIAITGPWT